MVKWIPIIAVFISTAVWAKQDPTAPLGWSKMQSKLEAKKNDTPPTLNAITCGLADCVAVINGKVVKLGDSVDGFKVTNIGDDLVKVTRSGKVWQLTLFSKDVKQ
ncbi:hypothetical protein [Vibrio sonorensis]|uniref:hypothetical protein n=1 Tax=Vibrio sonorensis TaxID=1004316 RepID=UPI0008DADEA6|nr:hypothetical protein [Vibrio sonorensis]